MEAQGKQPQAKPDETAADDLLVVSEDPGLAKVKSIREQIRATNNVPDSEVTASLLQQPRAQKLAALDQELQAALDAQRGSKPLPAQHAQVEAHLRRLNKAHDVTTSKLASAQAALEQAQLLARR